MELAHLYLVNDQTIKFTLIIMATYPHVIRLLEAHLIFNSDYLLGYTFLQIVIKLGSSLRTYEIAFLGYM